MRRVFVAASCLLLSGFLTASQAGEVAIYTGNTSWIRSKALADYHANVTLSKLAAWGVSGTLFANSADQAALATWVQSKTGNGQTDVLILYGYLPASIYPPANAQTDGSIAEQFIESTDGDMILNHGDWMFYVSSSNNGAGGLQNIMDIPGIGMGGDNTPLVATAAAKTIAPSVTDFLTDRPFHTNELAGDWYVEAALAQNADGTRVDPVIVRDGPRGRIAIAYQTANQNDPQGVTAAEMCAWIFGLDIHPTKLRIEGQTVGIAMQRPLQMTVRLLEDTGSLRAAAADTTVNLATTSTTGAFDTAPNGAFDGSVTSITIPAGEHSAVFYYKDPISNTSVITASSTGLASATRTVTYSPPGQVAIYTGNVGWIDKAAADAQAQICVDRLNLLGISNVWYSSETQKADVANWVITKTGNGETDVLVLYGYLPDTIYPPGNTQPDGSLAELFIESTDGDAIINHADWIFYVASPPGPNNGVAGLQNMIDTPGIELWYDNMPMTVTPEAAYIAPSTVNYLSDRPFPTNELIGDWFVEAAIAKLGRLADPVIIREGDRGRVISAFQASYQDDPKGAAATEIVAWLFGKDILEPARVGLLAGRGLVSAGRALQVTVQVQSAIGSPTQARADTTVSLQSTSATGAFDVAPDGAFDGSVTSVVVPEGAMSVVAYYKDTTPGTPTLTASAAGLASGTVDVKIFGGFATPGEVAIYTGSTWWIDKAAADAQAAICADRLNAAGISTTLYTTVPEASALATWMSTRTNNGKLDVVVLYGCLPGAIYPNGNAQPEGSIAELFIESPDGDAIMNHGDWMFYVDYDALGTRLENGPAGFQNMTDIAGIGFGSDNTPVYVTAEGRAIAPNLSDFLSDRPLYLSQLAGNWHVEAVLAQNADGSQAEPVVIRDGNLGRLIPAYQTNGDPDPKGAVGAEIIAWLMQTRLEPTQIAISGPSTTVAWTPIKFKVSVADDSGTPTPSATDLTVNLATSSATGAFDVALDGTFNRTVTSVTIPAGARSASFFYRDVQAGDVTLTASAAGLAAGTQAVKVFEFVEVDPGEVAIFTGSVGWIDKGAADVQSQICADKLIAAGIPSTRYPNATDEGAIADWVIANTNDGQLDVLVLYGYFPPSIYPAGNAKQDGSLAELFIETTDGDVILNHADYMFYVTNPCCNTDVALHYMMDIPVYMWGDDTPVKVTPEGALIAPTLKDYLTDRPFHLDELAGNWFPEAVLAEDASGTRSDPTIVRDGNLGRLIPVYQAAVQDDPKGAVAAEIITWLMANRTAACAKTGDTHVTDLAVTGPEGNAEGTYVATATATDDSGDPILYTFTAQRGVEAPVVVGPQLGNEASFALTGGDWTITVTVDDDPDCPDAAEDASRSVTVAVTVPGGLMRPGDMNADGKLDISDPVAILNHLFLGGGGPPCGDGSIGDPANLTVLDVSPNSAIDLSDAVYILNFLFLGGEKPINCVDDACPCIRVPGCPSVCAP